jgi:DNA-binding XRE family transcriptional regulator
MSIAHESSKRIPPSTLPLRLQQAREWRGFNQDDLAVALDVSRATISNYERGIGKRGMSRLQVNAWAAFCDVDVEWLKTGLEGGDTDPTTGGALSNNSEKLRFDNSSRENVIAVRFGSEDSLPRKAA